jgi:hypothetical protein
VHLDRGDGEGTLRGVASERLREKGHHGGPERVGRGSPTGW